jgi:hypothetical protein
MNDQTIEIKRKHFLWGVSLVWIPFLFFATPTLIGLYHAFRGVSREKATGLAAVAGGVTELLATFGLAVTLVFEVVAIILLLHPSPESARLAQFYRRFPSVAVDSCW